MGYFYAVLEKLDEWTLDIIDFGSYQMFGDEEDEEDDDEEEGEK